MGYIGHAHAFEVNIKLLLFNCASRFLVKVVVLTSANVFGNLRIKENIGFTGGEQRIYESISNCKFQINVLSARKWFREGKKIYFHSLKFKRKITL